MVPNGANVPVTNDNRLAYIMLYATWLMSGRIKEHVTYFVRGMRSVFSEEFFSIFFPDEIETLISGGSMEVDIDDLKKHTKYDGWDLKNASELAYLNHFWAYMKQMENEQREKFLLFVTGSERSPLLGFGFLSIPFTINKRHTDNDNDRVYPSASTCANMLSLPYFGNTPRGLQLLGETLSEAINSN